VCNACVIGAKSSTNDQGGEKGGYINQLIIGVKRVRFTYKACKRTKDVGTGQRKSKAEKGVAGLQSKKKTKKKRNEGGTHNHPDPEPATELAVGDTVKPREYARKTKRKKKHSQKGHPKGKAFQMTENQGLAKTQKSKATIGGN